MLAKLQAITKLPNYQYLLTKTKTSLGVKNANIKTWQTVIDYTGNILKGKLHYDKPYVSINNNVYDKELTKHLQKLIPWRKGPFNIGGVLIDSEWRSDMKWERLKDHISPLDDKLVLDVGCGNGYFSYLMALNNAKLVLGLEPYLLFNYQFYALYNLIKPALNISVLPLRVEQINNQTLFDSIFSMGVLYHQKSPIEHLLKLKSLLAKNGELILETLIVDGVSGYSLMPSSRYAQMPNVWFLPSLDTLINYLKRCGFSNIRVINSNKTSILEQRKTKWLADNAKSLVDFLDADNPKYTIEGYPSPCRVICICNK